MSGEFSSGYSSDFLITPAAVGGMTRNYWDQPGSNACYWNTPLGDGAIWGNPTDADTIDLRHGGFINYTENFGNVVWVSQSASDPTATFSGPNTNYDSPTGQTFITVTAHVVPGSYTAGPWINGIDQPYVFVDTTGHPGIYYQFSPLQLTSFSAGQGPFNAPAAGAEDAMSDWFATDQETTHGPVMGAAGLIRGYDLDPARNPARMPGQPNVTAIQHVLMFSHQTIHLKANANPANFDYPNGPLLPNSWPENYQDWQDGIGRYTGNYIYGTHCGIPINVPMPSGLTTAGQQLWWTLQHYGAHPRVAGGSDFSPGADQYVPKAWIDNANRDLPTIVQYLCPLRNQHQGGQSFVDHPINGPGNRVDVGPPPLAGTSTVPIVQSPNNTVVLAGSSSVITDSFGNSWGISASGVMTINGIADTTTSGVVQLAYVGGVVWQENSSGLWWGKTSTIASWSPASGTTTSPLTGPPIITSSGPQLLPAGYMSTSGNQIVDQQGRSVRIAAVYWPGGDSLGGAPLGLTSAPLSAMMAKIVALGFNCVRLAWNDAGFFISGATYIGTNTINPTLAGLTPLQVMDAMVAAAKVAKLKVIIVHYNCEGGTSGLGGQQANGLWFDSGAGAGTSNTGTVSQAVLQSHWVSFASRYVGNDTVIGFELHNAPSINLAAQFGASVTWGDGAAADIKAAWTTIGNAILAVNPNVLIICPGPANASALLTGTGLAPEGDLSRVATQPVSLNVPGKVVYSVREYPNAIVDTAGAYADSGAAAVTRMNNAWGSVVKNNLAPVMVTEIGASLDGGSESAATGVVAAEQAWSSTLVSYCNGSASGGPTFTSKQGISTCWASWGDLTGQTPNGVLSGGWSGTTRTEQQQVYSQIQFTTPITTPQVPSVPVLTVGTASTVSVPLSWTTGPTGTPSSDQSFVLAGAGGSIIDAASNVWTINAAGQVAINGSADTTTGSVIELAYVGGSVWQENSSNTWWGKTSPTASWSPAAGQTTSPLTSGGVTYQVQYKTAAASTWTNFGTASGALSAIVTSLTSGATYDFRVVATNSSGSSTSAIAAATTVIPGSPPPNTPPSTPAGLSATGVTGTSLVFSWSPSTGSAPISYQPLYRLHPVTPPPPPPPPPPPLVESAEKTIVLAGSTSSIIDANLVKWTISAGGQVTVNGTSDTTTSGVVELEYHAHQVYQKNSAGQWWYWSGTAWTSTTDPFAPLVESAEKTIVLAGSTAAIIDANLVKWTISAGGQVTVNGTSDTSTSSVVQLAYHNHQVYQKNSAGLFWYWSGTAWTSSPDPFAVKQAGYSVSNGLFIGPSGTSFKAKGVNSGDEQLTYFTAAAAKSLFPGINFVRLPFLNMRSTSEIAPFVNDMTSNGITVLLEHHVTVPSIPPAYSGQDLIDEVNWYTSLARAFGNNPLVWFASQNEPGGGDITAEHVAVYNAIRGTGSNNIILFDFLGGGNPGTVGANAQYGQVNVGAYASMYNVGWDLHFYCWMQDGTMDENQIKANLAGNGKAAFGISAAQTIRSADGLMPVIIGEFGPQEDGSKPAYPNGYILIDAVCTCGKGFVAWCMTPGGSLGLAATDPAHGGYYSISSPYGTTVASYIASQ